MRIGPCSTALGVLMLAAATPVIAQAQPAAVQFRVPAGPLQTALPLFAAQSGEQILYSTDLIAGRQSPGVTGSLNTDRALTALLEGTGLRARRTSPNTLVVFDPSTRAAVSDEATEIEDVIVTGSLIRGVADGPSPVVSVTRDQMDRQGRATVAQLLAALPQNFGGSANEGAINNGGDRSGTNSNYANGVNLRGLGSDATLVLINGRRLAGTGSKGDFVDVSTIPTAAVERVDILLDGASALYGADAVGGVVNIVLRDSYDGAETRVRVGNTADGASGEYQIAQVLGRRWASGSAMLTYEYNDRDALAASERRRASDADHTWLGGRDRRSFYSNPGNIVVLDPATGSQVPRYSIPDSQNGVGLLPSDFRLGQTNLENFRAMGNVLPRQTRQSVYAAARQSFGDRFEFSGDARWGLREYETVSTAITTLLTVTRANPYFASPTGTNSHTIAYSFQGEIAAPKVFGEVESFGASLG
ncbi:TonB-dependent receptor, partial [Brevundimonas sp.]|uniref:TonB-dependent receptor n=1 Tax=Brevundimonas sp. TaxID=1871086 RepID=UPI0028B0116C